MLCCEYIDDFTTLAEETLSPAWPVAVELPPKQRVQQAALEGKKTKKKRILHINTAATIANPKSY